MYRKVCVNSPISPSSPSFTEVSSTKLQCNCMSTSILQEKVSLRKIRAFVRKQLEQGCLTGSWRDGKGTILVGTVQSLCSQAEQRCWQQRPNWLSRGRWSDKCQQCRKPGQWVSVSREQSWAQALPRAGPGAGVYTGLLAEAAGWGPWWAWSWQ